MCFRFLSARIMQKCSLYSICVSPLYTMIVIIGIGGKKMRKSRSYGISVTPPYDELANIGVGDKKMRNSKRVLIETVYF